VCWDKRDGKWAASIKHDGKLTRKGRFSTEEEAARAFDDAARELRGGAAHGAKFKLNFPTVAEKQEAAAEPAKPAPLLGSLDVQQLLRSGIAQPTKRQLPHCLGAEPPAGRHRCSYRIHPPWLNVLLGSQFGHSDHPAQHT